MMRIESRAHQRSESLGYCEAKACTTRLRRVSAEKAIKDFRLRAWRQPGAIIENIKHDAAIEHMRLEHHLAAINDARAVKDGVFHQIEQNLMQKSGIGVEQGQARRDIAIEPNTLRNRLCS